MRRRALLGVLAVGGTAGCLRLEGGSETTARTGTGGTVAETVDTATATATDTATDSDPETTERADPTYPFGMSDDGVDSYLYSTCQTAVAELSYRAAYTKVDVESGELMWQREYEAAENTALGHWNRKGGGPVDAYHSVGGDFLWREAVGDGYTYGESTRPRFQEIFWSEEFQPLLKGLAWGAPERVNDARPAVWEVTADSVGETVRSPGHSEGELKSAEGARLRVDENGVIRSLQAVYVSSDARGNVRRKRFRFELSDVGAVSLSAPSWVDAAREQHPEFAARLTDDRKYVRLSMESGSMAPDSRISVFELPERQRKYVARTDREVSAGDVLYIHAQTDSGKFNDAGIGYGSRSAVGTPPTLDEAYHLVAFRRDTKYDPGVDVSPPSERVQSQRRGERGR